MQTLTPFALLPDDEQIARLNAAVRQLLVRLDLSPTAFVIQAKGHSVVYRIDMAGEPTFALRMQSPARIPEAMALSQIAWLRSLASRTPLQIPEPCSLPDGMPFCYAMVEGDPEPKRCLLVRWLPGRTIADPAEWSIAHFAALGRYVGTLHEHSRYHHPSGSIRRLDSQQLIGPDTFLGSGDAEQLLSPGELEVLRAAAGRICRELDSFGTHPDAFGLIHADLTTGNIIFDGQQANAIDFDEFYAGPYAYDVACALSSATGRADADLLTAAFVNSYAAIRPLPLTREQIPVLQTADVLASYNFDRKADPAGLRARHPGRVEHLRAFVRMP